jgi:hypothetical protein
MEFRLDKSWDASQDRATASTTPHKGSSPMYEYRILFPRLGSQQIRRELGPGIRVGADRRRSDGAYRPERPSRRERA